MEGKKTMGYELVEQLGWEYPDAVFYPTGGGVGMIGMWKAFEEMEQLGWVAGRRPKMIAVQSAGCAPVVRAFERGEEVSQMWQDAHTFASGLRVPKPYGDAIILEIVRASGGDGGGGERRCDLRFAEGLGDARGSAAFARRARRRPPLTII